MAVINNKTAARIAAIQALYQYQINDYSYDLEKLIHETQESYKNKDFNDLFEIPDNISVKLHNNYFRELLTQTISNVDKTDEIIKAHLADGWQHDNMHLSLLALLRVAITELIYFPEAPYKVIINEFTNLATELVKPSEVPFVNSLLDKVRIEYRIGSS